MLILILIFSGVACLLLLIGAAYYRWKARRLLRDAPGLARAIAIKRRTKTSYRGK